jgi:hypothetical protein
VLTRKINHQCRILYPVKLFFKGKGEIEVFLRNTETREMCCQETCLASNVKRDFYREEKGVGQNLRST